MRGGYTHMSKGCEALRGGKEGGEDRGEGRAASKHAPQSYRTPTPTSTWLSTPRPWVQVSPRRFALGARLPTDCPRLGFSDAPAHMAATNEDACQRRRGAAKEWRKGVAVEGRRNMCKARMPSARGRSGCGAIHLERCSLMQIVHATTARASPFPPCLRYCDRRTSTEAALALVTVEYQRRMTWKDRDTSVAGLTNESTDILCAPPGNKSGIRIHRPTGEEERGGLGRKTCPMLQGAKAHAS
ncbi:hypothetical protein B0H17DRAFT_1269932 [Mycena rosella]|uniref:Uncharacterized protein n=1 Tax=Mycena rosella TaxID=1033263 RepID=A0AAD7G018_MYCRO|nr:hypothetical protein B0H17DRAFT_1269932 [Mycena rosella]